MNCSYRGGHILSVLVMMVKFVFHFFIVKFLNKVWEKVYFTDMKASKFLAMPSSWNYKDSNCYELLLQGGHILSVLVMIVKFFFIFLSLNSWIKFEKRIILPRWKHLNSLQCFPVEITKLAIALNCSYREGHILSVLVMMVKFFFYFFSLNSWINFEKRIILLSWKHLKSFQCFPVEITKMAIAMNCSYREGHILSVLVMMVKFFFYFFLVKFLNKFWEKDYFTEMKASKLFPMLSSWNYKDSNCYELLLQRGPHPVCSRDDGEIFFSFFSR